MVELASAYGNGNLKPYDSSAARGKDDDETAWTTKQVNWHSFRNKVAAFLTYLLHTNIDTHIHLKIA